MSGIWYVVVPEASTNQVLNPSAEVAGNFGGLFVGSPSVSGSPSGSASPSASQSRSPSASTSPSGSQSISPSASQSRSPSASASPSGSASPSASVSPSPSPSFGVAAVSRVTTYARFGDYCYYIQTPKPYDGLWLALSTLANAAHYVSLYLYDNVTGVPEVSLDGRAFYAMSVIGGRDGGWVRYGVSIAASEANGSKRLDLRLPTEEDFYVDAVQVEANSYGTTYVDGDRTDANVSDSYRWAGLRHGSASTRSAQVRTGGRERNLLDDYGVEVVEGTKRIGMPPVIHSLQSQSLLPGALYQSAKVLPREIELHLNYSSDSWAGFHGKRNDVIDLFKPDLVRGSQPVVIGYAGPGTDKKVYARFYYNGGLEFGDFLAYDEVAQVRLLAPDPFWEADDQETAALDYQDSVTSAYALRRFNGQWQALGGGFNLDVDAITVDYVRGRVYFGGRFTSTGTRICYWDGTNLVTLGTGANNTVRTIAIAPNGDVWIGGAFTQVNGVNSYGLARWNLSTGTWTQFTNGTSGDVLYALAFDANGLLYGGGDFINWNGIANADRIWQYDGSTFSALGTGMNEAVYSISIFDTTHVYVGGLFTTGNGVTLNYIGYWDGTTFQSMSSGANSTVRAVLVIPNGEVFVTGNFATLGGVSAARIGKWSGASWTALGSGLNADGYALTYRDGLLVVCGNFTTAGGLTVARFALWNGYVWIQPDVSLPGGIVNAVLFWGDNLFIGHTTSGTATAAGLTTVTNGGSTAIYPRLTILNQNSSGSCILQWFENQSSDHRMYFNLTIQAGESVVLDLAQSQKRLVSDWRGVITDNPLKNSDVTNWRLLPGANIIAAFITGTITGVTALLHWTPKYWSADGAA